MENLKTKHLIIGMVILIVFILSGLNGYFLGIQKVSFHQNNSPPIPSATPFVTTKTTPIIPSSITTKPISIPSGWKTYTAEDTEFGIKTTMSLPPGYSFRFTGSEFTIQNDSDATELWDYSSSVYRDNDSVLKNHYDGSSRRIWYEKFLSETNSVDKIISVKEKPLNSSSYLEIIVKTPSYDDHGLASGTNNGRHYIYVQNNILHIIRPTSGKAYTTTAQIPDNIEPILASLKSSIE